MHERLKKWEIALICAVAVTYLWYALPSGTACAWWGAVYPEFSPDAGLQAVSAAAGGVELRFRLLEWLDACLKALKIG